MGIALWLVAGGTACAIARLIRNLRQSFVIELIVALISSLILGAVATALDFGGWAELDWRAGLFILIGSFTTTGLVRLLLSRHPLPAR